MTCTRYPKTKSSPLPVSNVQHCSRRLDSPAEPHSFDHVRSTTSLTDQQPPPCHDWHPHISSQPSRGGLEPADYGASVPCPDATKDSPPPLGPEPVQTRTGDRVLTLVDLDVLGPPEFHSCDQILAGERRSRSTGRVDHRPSMANFTNESLLISSSRKKHY
jgi:hypothetical protein